jgi:hypothetical protein
MLQYGIQICDVPSTLTNRELAVAHNTTRQAEFHACPGQLFSLKVKVSPIFLSAMTRPTLPKV